MTELDAEEFETIIELGREEDLKYRLICQMPNSMGTSKRKNQLATKNNLK